MCKKIQSALRKIGAALQRKDHTTLLHAYHNIKLECEDNTTLKQQIAAIEKLLV